jgi:hypothetical protein
MDGFVKPHLNQETGLFLLELYRPASKMLEIRKVFLGRNKPGFASISGIAVKKLVSIKTGRGFSENDQIRNLKILFWP